MKMNPVVCTYEEHCCRHDCKPDSPWFEVVRRINELLTFLGELDGPETWTLFGCRSREAHASRTKLHSARPAGEPVLGQS